MNDKWARDKEQQRKRLDSIEQLIAKAGKKAPQWYVNGQGQTLVVIPGPVELVMGSPMTEAGWRRNEVQYRTRIGRSFAVASTAVTKEQFLRFRPQTMLLEMRRYPEPTCPMGCVSWLTAAKYCNWLSKEEGFPEDQWCFEIKGDNIKLKANYLSLSGYRLPTEAEMEYVTRAGAATSRYFGETEELLPKYAWYLKNAQEKTWPVGSLKPNDLGFFDVLGNVYVWMQESYQRNRAGKEGEVIEDREDEAASVGTRERVLRGGSFNNLSSWLRSATRNYAVPTDPSFDLGIRPARTIRP